MELNIQTHLSYDFAQPTDVILQIELARIAGQDIEEDALFTTPVKDFSRIPGEHAIGARARMQAEGLVDITYRAKVDVTRPDPDLAVLTAGVPRGLTAEATSFLMPSRYCPSDEFQAFVYAEFQGLAGGPLIAAMRDWIEENFTYDSGASTASTTARESFVQRQGVCRDYAHVMITFARAAGIPARMASGYAPDVDPPDFHAVAEVWLSDAWHFVDATGMAKASEIAVIGVGRDAADVSFLASFGLAELNAQSVKVTLS
ncbi:Transglutaminase-like enzyme, putative cysteine protease [Jannaschia faecimaris]|uniref:Transglutaminase-like enzyme, putative cysteine protease n=1 Tax=Jannaschia faecimaris TaxID=1244108 RepID=A0A1H3LCZ0_9RHOB|nr:transglutaminase family protein [Jannaschia faecimaris]SDY62272.1 Transglutaminase-like enzyme, putative cysteine protease [Jannaschia faecimaris]